MLEQPELRPIVLFFINIGLRVDREPLETSLDYLAGIVPLELGEIDLPNYRSPYYQYYFGDSKPTADEPLPFWQLLGNLNVLRQKLRDYAPEDNHLSTLADFLLFVNAYQAAGIKILNTNPYQESDDSVQLMTVYKAKGQEFSAVFVLALSDEVWGSRARNQSSRIGIPANLQFIRYSGASEDERLRLLFVALTRAKSQLYLTSSIRNFSGATQTPVKYLLDVQTPEIQSHDDAAPPSIQDLSLYWYSRHEEAIHQPKLRSLLADRLQGFQLSATQVNRFTDTSHGGPSSLLMRDLLKFPSGSSILGIYGDCIHETLSWLQQQINSGARLPNTSLTIEKFQRILDSKNITALDKSQLFERGIVCLEAYQAQRAEQLKPEDQSEYNFRGEGVFVGEAHLSGKIDRLIIDKNSKSITVVDFKTGKSHSRWTNDLKLLHYKQQLYFYKLLVEGSMKYRGYRVNDAYLEFVEPNDDGVIQELHVQFNEAEFNEYKLVVQSVWKHIQSLDFPNTDAYSQDAKGSLLFQFDLSKEV